jgi:hypothetical protein
VQIVAGRGDLDQLCTGMALDHLFRLVLADRAFASDHDERGAGDLFPLLPAWLRDRVPQHLHHHVDLEPRPPAVLALLEAARPRVCC